MDLSKFFGSAWERHRIYVLKELNAPKPWSQSSVFQRYYFCNVFRDLDKTSLFIRQVIHQHEDDPRLWKAIFLMRYISKLETLQDLHEKNAILDHDKAYRLMRTWTSNGRKLFTSAFIVNSRARGEWVDKITYIFRLIKEVHGRMNENPDIYLRHMQLMESCYYTLYGLPGVGGFMAYQYTVDLHYAQRYLANVRDARTWTALGIGALRGMNRLLGNPAKKTRIPNQIDLTQEILKRWEAEVFDNKPFEMQKTYESLPEEMKTQENFKRVVQLYARFHALELSDVQHWLCEYDKYMRGGSQKRRYPGV